MKRIYAFFIAVMIAGSALAEGVNYYNQSWTDIKAKAKAEHKYIFMDCYTDWCYWCKVMDKETMIDPGVIALLNGKFIPVKMDMEKGEGIKLAMKYHISAYPSFMVFNPDGEFVFQSAGYVKTPDFTKELNDAVTKSKQMSTPGYSADLDIDYPLIYRNMFIGNGKNIFAKEEEVTPFLDQQKDLFSEISWAVISRCALSEKYKNFFLSHISDYTKLYGSEGVQNRVSGLIQNQYLNAVKSKDKAQFDSCLQMEDKYAVKDKEIAKTNMRINFYTEIKDWNASRNEMNLYVKKNGFENSGLINSVSWKLFEECDDKTALKSACDWMKGVAAKDPQYAYLDTYAWLLYKTGQRKNAQTWAEKAIEAGKRSGDKTESTEALLQKIKDRK